MENVAFWCWAEDEMPCSDGVRVMAVTAQEAARLYGEMFYNGEVKNDGINHFYSMRVSVCLDVRPVTEENTQTFIVNAVETVTFFANPTKT